MIKPIARHTTKPRIPSTPPKLLFWVASCRAKKHVPAAITIRVTQRSALLLDLPMQKIAIITGITIRGDMIVVLFNLRCCVS
jgi:hypothetical protein